MNHFPAIFSDTEIPCNPLKMLKYFYGFNGPHATTSHRGHGYWNPELNWCNCSASSMILVEATGSLQEDAIAGIAAKANITQTTVKFTKILYFIFLYFHTLHNTYMACVHLGQISVDAALLTVSLHHGNSTCPSQTGTVVTSCLTPVTGREPQGAKKL